MTTPELKERENIDFYGIITPTTRRYLPEEEKLETWDAVMRYADELLERPIDSADELEAWLLDRSEFESVISERTARKYIAFTRNSLDPDLKTEYERYTAEVIIPYKEISNRLDKKYADSPYRKALDPEQYGMYNRGVETDLKIFRKENLPLLQEEEKLISRYTSLTGGLMVTIDGKELTMPQAARLLEKEDRALRERVYHAVGKAYLNIAEKAEEIFNRLVALRHQRARNAGYDNFEAYTFDAFHRFYYTIDDTLQYHASIRKVVLPLYERLLEIRKARLGVDKLRPYDLEILHPGQGPLEVALTGDAFIEKVVEVLGCIHPDFGQYFAFMHRHGFLDLFTRKGKAPGGYNYGLSEIGIPFIFMNASGSVSDVRVIMHEAGHAMHSFLTRHYPFAYHRDVPIEMAELASQAMEFLSLEHWGGFLKNPDNFPRVVEVQLTKVFKLLLWIAVIDKFQWWIYHHPQHTPDERKAAWLEIFREFTPSVVDYEGLEGYLEYQWHRQPHLYHHAFYYIEYGISLLGALEVFRNYRRQPAEAIEQYRSALQLGNTRPLPELFAAAGASLDFSESKIRDIIDFLKGELTRVVPESL